MIGTAPSPDGSGAVSRPHRSNNLHTVMQAAHPPSAGSNRNSIASLSRNNSAGNVLNTVRDDYDHEANAAPGEPIFYATAPRPSTHPRDGLETTSLMTSRTASLAEPNSLTLVTFTAPSSAGPDSRASPSSANLQRDRYASGGATPNPPASNPSSAQPKTRSRSGSVQLDAESSSTAAMKRPSTAAPSTKANASRSSKSASNKSEKGCLIM